MKRILALSLLAVLATRVAPAQTLQQVVDKKKAAVSAKIEAAKLPDNIKAAFRGRVTKAGTYQLESQDREFDRIDADVGNNERGFAEWTRVDTYIRSTTGITQKIRDYYIGLMQNARDVYFPDQTAQLWGRVGSLQTGVDNFKPLIVEINAYMKKVADNAGAPAILKTQTNKRLQAIIDRLGPSSVTNDWSSFSDEKSGFTNSMIVVGELDKLATRVAAEAPAAYPAFVTNTKTEIANLRKDVGNPMGNTPMSAVDDLSTRFTRRNVLMRLCAEIKAKIPLLPAEDRPSYQRKLDELAADVVNWHGAAAPDDDRIRRLHSNIMQRFY